MAPVGKIALFAVVAMVIATGSTYANVIPMDDDKGLELKSDEGEMAMDDFYKFFLDYFSPPTVGHFATHNLCKRLRKPFEVVIKKKLMNMSDTFVTEFVDNLCDKHPHVMLKLWVSELFDADKNGYVDDHEKNNVIDHNYDD